MTLKASLGTLHTLADVPDDVVQGRGTKQMTVSTSDRMLLNFILQHVTYTSTVYQLHGVDVGKSLSIRRNLPVLTQSLRFFLFRKPLELRFYPGGLERVQRVWLPGFDPQHLL